MYLFLDYQINKTLFQNIKSKTAISTRRTSLRWLERASKPKPVNIFYQNSLTHSNLETDMTGSRVLKITEIFLLENFHFCKNKFCPLKKIQ